MRKFFNLFVLAAILVMSAAGVRTATAAGNPATTTGLIIKYFVLNPTFVRTWDWNITKTSPISDLLLEKGQTATVPYNVSVIGTPVDSGWTVSGVVSVVNRTGGPVTVNSVVVNISPNIQVATTCVPPSALPTIPNESGIQCSFTTTLPDGATRSSAAVITSSYGTVTEPADQDIVFSTPASVTGQTINVTDTLVGFLGTVTGSANPTTQDFSYNFEVGPYGTCGNYLVSNTATIVENNRSSSHDVNVNVPCYENIVITNHEVTTSFNRSWDWNIVKSSSADNPMTLPVNTVISVPYNVTVTGVPTDSGFFATGSVSFENTGDNTAVLTSVAVDISGIAVTPVCGSIASFPANIAPGESVTCTYASALPDGNPRTSTATVSTSLASVSDGKAVIFGDPTTETGQTIQVADSLVGILGSVTGTTNPTVASFDYSYNVGPYSSCGDYTVVNTAKIVGTGRTSSHTLNINVPCANGCTLTQGFWKTHSRLGPAPYSSGWQVLGASQEQTIFFLSGKSWYTIFWTAPKGNVYYILAHQYMAAKLNILNGAATTPEVTAAITAAESFFNTYTPSSSLSSAVKNSANANATLLDNYNNGLIGPGHCSE